MKNIILLLSVYTIFMLSACEPAHEGGDSSGGAAPMSDYGGDAKGAKEVVVEKKDSSVEKALLKSQQDTATKK